MTTDFLNKEVIRPRLVNVSLFLLAYQMLKSSIVDGVRDFFIDGHDGEKFLISPEYDSDVSAKSKYTMDASLLWLKEMEVLTDENIQDIHALREYRNDLAHDIPERIIGEDKVIDPKMIDIASFYLHKIDNFWGQIEADINPDFDGEEIDYEGIKSLRWMILQNISEIVREDENKKDI